MRNDVAGFRNQVNQFCGRHGVTRGSGVRIPPGPPSRSQWVFEGWITFTGKNNVLGYGLENSKHSIAFNSLYTTATTPSTSSRVAEATGIQG